MVGEDPCSAENLFGNIVGGKDAAVDFDNRPVLLLMVFHHQHISSPAAPMNL
ncbi:uncharacterized protein METZ01_LOCUS406619, partial [marine metagenome]